jgi:hypothetical protein
VIDQVGNRGQKKPGQSKPSARRGGPANFQGTGYQVDVAVLEALRLVQSELWQPDSGASLSMEPRIVDSTGQVGFDLAIRSRNVHFEAKLSPNRQDVMEWLQSLPDGHQRESDAIFTLVHARGGAPAADVAEIWRVAHEAPDEPRFAELSGAALDGKQRTLLEALGDRSWEVARQIEVVQRSEQDVRERASWMAEGLSGADGVRLIEMLTNEIRGACAERRSIPIGSLIEENKKARYIPACAPDSNWLVVRSCLRVGDTARLQRSHSDRAFGWCGGNRLRNSAV